jgi:outer membrane protein assembly factor BamB
MGRVGWRLAVALITFLAGAFLASMFASLEEPTLPAPLTERVMLVAPTQPRTSAPPTSETSDARCEAQGARPLSRAEAIEVSSASRISTVVVAPNHLLMSGAHRVYMLDSQGCVAWRWPDAEVDAHDLPYLTARPLLLGDTLYLIATDLTHVALDARTGREKWHSTACGRALYTQIEKYTDDQYLVLVDMSGYEGATANLLEAYNRDNECLWSIDFPRGASLSVRAGKIYAVARRGGRSTRTEISPPTNVGGDVTSPQ